MGRYVARALELPFYDSDAEIERRTGVDIPFIFEIGGRERVPPARARGHRGADGSR